MLIRGRKQYFEDLSSLDAAGEQTRSESESEKTMVPCEVHGKEQLHEFPEFAVSFFACTSEENIYSSSQSKHFE